MTITHVLFRETAEKHADVAILALNAMQQAAKLALTSKESTNSDSSDSKSNKNNENEKVVEKLIAVKQLVKRAAKSNVQQEELSTYLSQTNQFVRQLQGT